MSLLPQFGFLELLLVAAVALVIVGPRDLPRLMRSVGQGLAQMRRMAADFTQAFDQMAREAEMDEMRKEIDALKRDNVFADAKRAIDDAVAPTTEALRAEAQDLRAAGEAAGQPTAAAANGAETTKPSDDAVASVEPKTVDPEPADPETEAPTVARAGGESA